MRDIILAGGARTPFGDFGKSLKDTPLTRLGAHAVQGTLHKAGISADDVEELVLGITTPVDRDGLFASRKIALLSGIPIEATAMAVSRACASGSQAIASAAQQISSGQVHLAVAAGAENFSRLPFIAQGVRWTGAKRGPIVLEDGQDFAYRCPVNGNLMGETGETLAERCGYRREAMDDWAFMSQGRAQKAIENGFLKRQIVPIAITDGRATRSFDVDEFPRFNTTRDKLSSLKPVFKKDGGLITAGNSSGVTDGAASIIVAERAHAEKLGITSEARLVDWAVVGVPPEIMGAGPVPAIRRLLDRNNLSIADIDYFEINEAFAVVNLHAERELGISRDRTNLYGGGISIGHPPGATGVRMTITAMHHLADSKGRYAIISMCAGGGQGMATLIENLAR